MKIMDIVHNKHLFMANKIMKNIAAEGMKKNNHKMHILKILVINKLKNM